MSRARSFVLWGPLLAYAVALSYLSVRPGVGVLEKGWDKLFHAVAYGFLTALVLRALRGGRSRVPAVVSLLSASAATAYGAGMEAVQALVPGRFASFGDVLANALGAAAVALIAFVWPAGRGEGRR